MSNARLAPTNDRGLLLCAVLWLLFAITPPAQARTEAVLYSFGAQKGDGSLPYASLVRDANGNLYGTTVSGGKGYGTVFMVTPTGKESVLYGFTGGADGAGPCAGLIRDSKGDLFGTTIYGGYFGGGCAGVGCGTVFEVIPGGVEKVLYAFTGKSDGAYPISVLVRDKNGNFYGTTGQGGDFSNCSFGCGTVFKLTLKGKEKVLYAFTGNPDGMEAQGDLVFDAHRNLFGTTVGGGGSTYCTDGCGTVFEITASGAEKLLYSFQGPPDGYGPEAGLVRDGEGNLFGTTLRGGTEGYDGAVFRLTMSGQESVLYSFTGTPDGASPWSSLIMDKKGNLYGTTAVGGTSLGNICSVGCGTVFKVSTLEKETVLYRFQGPPDGYAPEAGLVRDGKGNLYGTTASGGAFGSGTVFVLKP